MKQNLCQNNYISQMMSGVSPIEKKPYAGIIEIKNELSASDYWVASPLGENPNRINPKILISGDYNIFNEGWNENGVYACSGKYQSETYLTPWYIGSAWGKNGLQKRIQEDHILHLNGNSHPHNLPLQNAWNKHGQEKFVWWLLEICLPEECLEREQYYLDLYRPFVDELGGFNIAHFVDSPNKDRTLSEESRQKMSQARKGMKFSEEHKRNISESLKGRFKGENSPNYGAACPEERKAKISASNRGKRRSKETKRKLSEIATLRFADPKNRPMLGRKKTEEQIAKHSKAVKKQVTVLNPNGEIVVIKGVGQFCKEHGFSDNFNDMLNGKILHYRGWRLVENKHLEDLEPIINKKLRDCSMRVIVKSPEGEIVNINGVSKFCKERNLNRSCFVKMIYGISKQHKGWVLIELLYKPISIPKWKQN